MTFNFIAERASLVLVENDVVRESLGRRRLLGKHFLRNRGGSHRRHQGPGDAERRPGERSHEGGEPPAVSAGAAGAAAVKSGLEETVGDGEGGGGPAGCSAASGGESSEENGGGSPSHIGMRSACYFVLRGFSFRAEKGFMSV